MSTAENIFISMSFSRCRKSGRLFYSTGAPPLQNETQRFLEMMAELTQRDQELGWQELGVKDGSSIAQEQRCKTDNVRVSAMV